MNKIKIILYIDGSVTVRSITCIYNIYNMQTKKGEFSFHIVIKLLVKLHLPHRLDFVFQNSRIAIRITSDFVGKWKIRN